MPRSALGIARIVLELRNEVVVAVKNLYARVGIGDIHPARVRSGPGFNLDLSVTRAALKRSIRGFCYDLIGLDFPCGRAVAAPVAGKKLEGRLRVFALRI